MKISLCQINLKIANLKYNIEKIKKLYESESTNSDLVIFPELSLTGYLLKDLVNDLDFLDKVLKFRAEVVKYTKEKKCALLFGCPVLKNNKVFNSVIVACDGKEIFSVDKYILPNYEVFNEPRNFSKAENEPTIFEFKEVDSYYSAIDGEYNKLSDDAKKAIAKISNHKKNTFAKKGKDAKKKNSNS